MARNLERRRSIWVIDDSATDAERVRRLLHPEHDVEVMHDGAAALERLASGSLPDLIVLDWVMPGISGIEVCRYVRSAGGKLPQVPILLLTVRHGTQEILQAFKSGANDYVSKPFVSEELHARVSALLESKALLERAEQAEADLRTLLENAPDPIFAVDAQGIVSFVNDEGVRVLGRPPYEIVGRPLRASLPGISLRNIAVGPGQSFLPVPDIEIDGRVFAPAIRVLPSDSAASTTVALRDETARRHAEARRLDFYSIIAHDLRSPLTAVLLRLDMIFRGKHGVLPAGLIADLRNVESGLRSQVGMINDFLELARLEGIGYKIDRAPLDLAELIRTTMEDFQPLLENRHLQWLSVGLDRQATVVGDRQRLSQVLTNLIGNAIKFTPEPGSVATTLLVTEDHVEASVEDTGRGIAKDELPHLFERFARSPEAADDTAGSGLGLMIVRELVEAHGGIVGAESEPGVGSRFWFRLPRYEGDDDA